MKKINFIVLVLIFSGFALQGINAQGFTVKGGLTLAKMLEKDNDEDYSDMYDMNPGFHAGISFAIPLTDFMVLEPGLMFTTKGMRLKEEEAGLELIVSGNLYYLDLPVNIKTFYDLGNGIKIFGTAGPYAGMGISGKVKATARYQGEEESEEEEVSWGNDEENDDLKRPDWGLSFGGGIEYNSIILGISYDLGLANISTYQDDGYMSKNRVLKISVGYVF